MQPRSFRSWLPDVALLLLLVACSGPAAWWILPAHAGTTSGTAVTVSGLDALATTVDTYRKGTVGKMLDIGLGIDGMRRMGGGRLGLVTAPPSMRRAPPRCSRS